MEGLLDIEVFEYASHSRAGEWEEQVRHHINSCDVMIFFWGKEIGKEQKRELVYGDKIGKIILPVQFENHFKTDALDVLSLLNEKDIIIIKKLNNPLKCAHSIVEKLSLVWRAKDGLPYGYPFEYEKDIIQEFIVGKGNLSSKRVHDGCPREWPRVRLFERDDLIENPISKNVIGGYRDWNTKEVEELYPVFKSHEFIIDVLNNHEDMNKFRKEDINKFRLNPQVLSATLDKFNSPKSLMRLGLTFPEAGPRKFHYYPDPADKHLKVGILVSGGIAPGINAVIIEIIKRHKLYAQGKRDDLLPQEKRSYLDIYGFTEGFKSLIQEGSHIRMLVQLDPDSNDPIKDLSQDEYNSAHQGGSILPTSRNDVLTDFDSPEERNKALTNIVTSLKKTGINILYIIGGDGSMKAAHALSNYAKQMGYTLSVVAIPKTMDNDILWVWQSFGFPSAVEWAKGAVQQLHKEVTSNPRLCIIQLFGTDSGFVVSHAAQSSGVCDLVLPPEIQYSMKKISTYIKKDVLSVRFRPRGGKSPYAIVLLAENAIPIDAKEYLELEEVGLDDSEKEAIKNFEKNGHRVHGQTSDELRSAGLKIVSRILQKKIRDMPNPYWHDFRVFTNEPRHLIRSIPPSSADITIAERLGVLAVDGAMAGYTDFMISQWLTEYVMVPLQLVVLGRKRIPKDGVFWKSVIAKTGQPADLK